MDRREALKRLALLTGGALSMSTIAGVLGGCRAGSAPGYRPQTLSSDQHELVATIAELIIPETDTPGACGRGAGSSSTGC
ncbi:gluconate 2-dehydrogenase subunit 3 family protein [Rhodothermus marinus]|uniref:gluconate 2-dehydrogenase subunit 3 family protein n=1 Tax=Rhodothermus marinus TaxID=29549 RepID=UPI000AAC513C|nr:gluconate 2-dehydrogenase subunit 3 family protein [Rhodothermus marinus]